MLLSSTRKTGSFMGNKFQEVKINFNKIRVTVPNRKCIRILRRINEFSKKDCQSL